MSSPAASPAARLQRVLGIESSPVSHRERFVSALGGLLGLLAVYASSDALVGHDAAPLLTMSIGATAVLVFAVPHGTLSQPWAVIGGHLVSGLIGVACAQLVPHALAAAGLAVGLAIGAMHYLRCLHPPGGATALAAVAGGEAVRALGFGFVLAPVMLNVAVILVIAIAFNALFPWRRYPAAFARRERVPAPIEAYGPISHEDFVFALTQVDSFIDVSEDDLLRIYALATGRQRDVQPPAR